MTLLGWATSAAADSEEGRTIRLMAASDEPVDLAVAWAVHSFPCMAASGDRCPFAALIARDDDFADSLAAGGFRGSPTEGAGLEMPLLLTDSDALSPETRRELERYGRHLDRVIVLGGDQAVSAAVEHELQGMGLRVERLDGADRIETAVRITAYHLQTYEPFDAERRSPTLLVRAYGSEEDPTAAFADALAVGSLATSRRAPVLLTATETLSSMTGEFMRSQQQPFKREHEIATRVRAVGGPQAMSDDVLAEVERLGLDITRIAGAERAATAVAVITQGSGLFDVNEARSVTLIEGYRDISWAEGLPASGPILLAAGTELPQATRDYLTGGDGGTSLVCGPLVEAEACNQAADLLGLPPSQ